VPTNREPDATWPPGARALVYVEVPRGSRVKRELKGARLVTEYLSPFASPFNYGCVRAELSTDGDPVDALVLGPAREAGTEVLVRIRGVVDFVDAGLADPKLVCSGSPPSVDEKQSVERFFRRYALARALLNRLQRKPGLTAFNGVRWR
jgi:inorganic pyrophosphatase